MSTNYYLHAPACPHCKTETEKPRHLGKSSAGWCFALHVYPEKNLHNWQNIWNHIDCLSFTADHEIKDEYGRIIDLAMFFGMVWDRKGNPEKLVDKEWLKNNHAIPGPFGLARHRLDDRCIGHGNGPFDYIIGDFE